MDTVSNILACIVILVFVVMLSKWQRAPNQSALPESKAPAASAASAIRAVLPAVFIVLLGTACY